MLHGGERLEVGSREEGRNVAGGSGALASSKTVAKRETVSRASLSSPWLRRLTSIRLVPGIQLAGRRALQRFEFEDHALNPGAQCGEMSDILCRLLSRFRRRGLLLGRHVVPVKLCDGVV